MSNKPSVGAFEEMLQAMSSEEFLGLARPERRIPRLRDRQRPVTACRAVALAKAGAKTKSNPKRTAAFT